MKAFRQWVLCILLSAACAHAASPKLSTTDELKDKRIGVLSGSAHVDYVQKTWPKARMLQFAAPADLLLAVKTEKVDAGLSDAEPLREMMREDKSLGQLGGVLFSFPEGVGFRKDNAALRDEFNRFLAKLKKDGVLADMVKRWVEQGNTALPAPNNTGANGELVVGISDGTLPFVAVKDNQLTGFDIELSERFGAHLGKRVRYSNMPFDSLIAAVASGKVDMIINSIFITDERKQSIHFSDPYYEEGVLAFGLKKNISAYDGIADTGPAMTFSERITRSFHNNIIAEQRYLLLWDGLKTTLIIAIGSALFGTLLGALICWMRMSPAPALHWPARAIIGFLRGIPVLVLLMLIFYVAFASVDIHAVLVAVFAFGLNFAGYTAEIFRSGVESIDRGQSEAGAAMGFGRVATFAHIVLPQTVQRVMPVYRGEFISLVKMTAIVGYIAVQDLAKAGDIIRSRTFDAFFPLIVVAVLYFVLAWLLMLGLEYLERCLNPQRGARS